MRKGNREATSNVNLTVYAVIEERGGGGRKIGNYNQRPDFWEP